MNPGFVIAAPSSGCGKTTFTMGLLRALTHRGLRVQPYKCGPDYIDTLFHQMASGRESVNLDTFMASSEQVKHLFQRYSADADVCVVEGAMGLYDGYDKSRGSAAEIARLLGVPTLLVVDAKSMAYSVAALLHGIKTFKPINLAGVVFNRVGSESHYRHLLGACENVGVHSFGYLSNNPLLQMPSRHLGLSLSGRETCHRFIALAAKEVEEHVDLEGLLGIGKAPDSDASIDCRTADSQSSDERKGSRAKELSARLQSVSLQSKTIAIARDEAFNFTYRANIDALAEMGTVVFFSPLHDGSLPPCDILYLPGGYPELYASELSENSGMRHSVKAYAEQGGGVIAECGGFMYLCSAIDGAQMCDVLPFKATMEGAKLHLGYRQIMVDGVSLRGHEFHYSTVHESALPNHVKAIAGQCSALGEPVDTPVYRYKNVLAGYTHWYWAEKDASALSSLWHSFINS